MNVMDVYNTNKRSEVMRAVKSKNTKPELRVRSLLHRAGLRFRLHDKNLPGRPDIVFPSRRAVIFVHGCFWHQHPDCPHAARPASNSDYWNRKLSRNSERDGANLEALAKSGWRTLVLWECQIKTADVVSLVKEFLTQWQNT
jgi:DNA mismatch endonuclease (patch repair protein)